MNPDRPCRSIAWLDTPEGDAWGSPDSLALPLGDRGLLLADGLFETVLVEDGEPRLLEEHLQRWQRSAALLGLAPPPDRRRLLPLVREAVQRSGIGQGALRLNWSRGSGGRGLDLPEARPGEAPPLPRFWLQLSAWQPDFQPVSTIVSRWERRNAASRLSRCKTFAYGGSIQARREAREAGAEDALLLSTTGELCCGTAANLLVIVQGRWLTPPDTSGCLPGVMRQRALAGGRAIEASISPDTLAGSEGVLLINSLSCRPIHRVDDLPLPRIPAAAAAELWRQLFSDSPAQRLDR
ncbi:MAG: aminotransferase class IV [Cyanobacteriota bacterium]|jgi:branched-subunit amino acid aminotransferase/4-amino-4-deoxychorismate lyase